MPDRTVVEETESGYQMVAAVAIRYRGPSGSFVSREEFVTERDREIREAGYGEGGYGR